jgi:hypothetical protein
LFNNYALQLENLREDNLTKQKILRTICSWAANLLSSKLTLMMRTVICSAQDFVGSNNVN